MPDQLPPEATEAAIPAGPPAEPVHEPGCECLEFGCTKRIRSHGCYCAEPDQLPPEAIPAEVRQAAVNVAAAYEPEAFSVYAGNPEYFLSVLLETARRVAEAIYPLVTEQSARAREAGDAHWRAANLRTQAAMTERVATAVNGERERWEALLADHYLAAITCDHAMKRDRAECACSLVNLGWQDNVGAARDTWIAHVADLIRARGSS